MEEIWNIFGDGVRATIPLLEMEVKGGPMLKTMTGHLFTKKRPVP